MAVREPGLVDYLLAGGAGLAKGVAAGTAQRQKREFREEQADINKRQFTQKFGLDLAQLMQRKKEFKETQKFQKMIQELVGEQRLEQIQETAKLKAKATKGSFIDQFLDRTKAVVDIQRVRSLITSTEQGNKLAQLSNIRDERRLSLETSRVRLAQDIAEESSMYNSLDALNDYYKLVGEPDTKLWMEEQRIRLRRHYGEMSDEEKQFMGTGYWLLMTTAQTQNKEIAKLTKEWVKGMDEFWKKKGLPAPKIDIDLGERSFWEGWIDEDPEIRVTPGEITPGQALPSPMRQRPQVLDETIGSMQGILQRLGILAPTQAEISKPRTAIDITNMIQTFQQRKIKALTQEHIDGLRQVGFDDEQIAQIQEGLE